MALSALTAEMYGLLRCCLLGEEGEGSSGSASWRWEDTQPLSEPVEPERQRDDEPELSVAEDRKKKKKLQSGIKVKRLEDWDEDYSNLI